MNKTQSGYLQQNLKAQPSSNRDLDDIINEKIDGQGESLKQTILSKLKNKN